ncbi:hypothetical protein BN134_1150 [Cronobacter dublinensis 1210]|uniref:Uncharacterized protein n=1 Tax=Cronobacter dublinensis 1210 TaxID=1208656 RepID=A0ABP1W781_9ENTR|nr:hypothetical protein BN134_1150 [Cronobacter dublinensis 1210]
MTSAGANVNLYFWGDKRRAAWRDNFFHPVFFLKKQLKRN